MWLPLSVFVCWFWSRLRKKQSEKFYEEFYAEAFQESCQTSKIEHFEKIVNC